VRRGSRSYEAELRRGAQLAEKQLLRSRSPTRSPTPSRSVASEEAEGSEPSEPFTEVSDSEGELQSPTEVADDLQQVKEAAPTVVPSVRITCQELQYLR
jgi:hypothetical protein